jgi:hypothetical protein
LSGRREWQADWIWLPAPVDAPDVYAHARREFEIEGEPSDARLRISANNIYRLHVNGIRIGRGPDRADPRFPYYDEYDVAPHLQRGTNVIAVDLYCILTAQDRGRSWCLYGGDPGLLLQLDYLDAGESRFLVTDEDWRIIRSPAWRPNPPRITRFLGYVEHYDALAAEALDGYRERGFDDAAWQAPKLLGKPPGGPVGDPLARESNRR